MNERIQALALQCYKTDPLCRDGWPSNSFDEQKFAELIVRECCDIVHSKTDESIRVVMAIEQHFGVEE
jgi:hypothetical protein